MQIAWRHLGGLLLAFGFVVAACSADGSVGSGERASTVDSPTQPVLTPAAAATPAPTSTAQSQPTTSPNPPTTAAQTPTPIPTTQPEGPCDAGPLALPNPDRPRYTADLDIDPEMGTVTGTINVAFTPDLGIDQLVVRLWPNGPRPAAGGVTMTLADTRIDGVAAQSEILSPTLVFVPLEQGVSAGDTVVLDATFELTIPTELKSRLSGRDDYMRLGTILPILPWEPGVGWATDPATSLFAEAVLSPVADYEVTVSVPPGYDVLASGIADESGTWSVESARDFALSIGRFRVATGTAMAPEPVRVTVGVHETLGDSADAYLAKVIDSLEQFSSRWGQYPWPSLTFALTPNLGGGIEFPTHIMQGPDTIGRTTSHEVGHMFFYSLVGNNQAAAPWLDEGITSYAEFTYEGVGAGAYAIPTGGVGNATEPMVFWEGRSDIYYRSVYGQTGFALLQLGSQVDVDCALARYVATNAHSIATAADFVAAFEPTFPDVIERLAALGVDLTE